MTIQTDLYADLDAEASITASFYLTDAPVGAKAPIVEINLTDHHLPKTTGNSSSGHTSEFEFECWHTTTALAETLANSIKTYLRDYTGTLNSGSPATKIWWAKIFNEFSSHDSAAELFGSTFTVKFNHNEV
jgi:hypothetical protein|tara:strand:- start:2268 stop:2660 length:393 start_codon:yes stop_codon:yes gene_type:complete